MTGRIEGVEGTPEKAERNYALLVSQLKAGRRPALDLIEVTLEAAGRGWRQLVADALSKKSTRWRSGDPCPQCGGPLRVYATRRQREGNTQTRYFHCGACKQRPAANKQVLPASMIRRRKRRKAASPRT